MQNTNTKTVRNIVRNILKQNNVSQYRSFTNKCANPELRNLCFITKNITPAVVHQIQAALNVTKVHVTKPMCYTYAHPDMRYLRIVHCSK